MDAVEVEQILVIPTAVFHACGHFQGFSGDTARYLHRILDPEVTDYLPRNKMEEDPSFKQLIPYCIFRHTAEDGSVSIFQYARGKGGGEARLHAKYSVGIGGHISSLDADDDSPYEKGMQRELDEEVTIKCHFDQHCVGLINDDENEVGKVHLGVVHIFDVATQEVTANEVEIEGSGFEPLESIMERLDQFETWSQICLEALFGK